MAGFSTVWVLVAVAFFVVSGCEQQSASPKSAARLTIIEMTSSPGYNYCDIKGVVVNSGSTTIETPVIALELGSGGAFAGYEQTVTDVRPLTPGQRSTFRLMYRCADYRDSMRLTARDVTTEIELLDQSASATGSNAR